MPFAFHGDESGNIVEAAQTPTDANATQVIVTGALGASNKYIREYKL